MRVTYDPDADAMYIQLKNAESVRQQEIAGHTILDFDAQGNVIGIELLNVRERMPDVLKEFQVENLLAA